MDVKKIEKLGCLTGSLLDELAFFQSKSLHIHTTTTK